jgi:hypothetical protein
LFSNPKAFTKELKKRQVFNALNLHPASGILPHEEAFEEIAKILGYDARTTKEIPWQATNQTFMKPFMDIVIGKLEKDGVDFFWLDWQQGEDWKQWTKIEALNPTVNIIS